MLFIISLVLREVSYNKNYQRAISELKKLTKSPLEVTSKTNTGNGNSGFIGNQNVFTTPTATAGNNSHNFSFERRNSKSLRNGGGGGVAGSGAATMPSVNRKKSFQSFHSPSIDLIEAYSPANLGLIQEHNRHLEALDERYNYYKSQLEEKLVHNNSNIVHPSLNATTTERSKQRRKKVKSNLISHIRIKTVSSLIIIFPTLGINQIIA